MTIWLPDLSGRKGPRYLVIAEAIGDAVSSGELAAGSRLPTHRELAYRLHVTVGTVSRAYAEAERRGHLVGEVGRGTFVRGADNSEYDLGFAIDLPDDDSGPIELGVSYPVLPEQGERLAESLAALSRCEVGGLLRNQPEGGMAAHREAGARLLESLGVSAPADRVVITCGAQHAISVLCATFSKPGDLIFTESHTYPGIMMIAQQLQLRVQGLPVDDEGLLPDALDEACRRSQARLLCITPTLQNPTTALMSEGRRSAIAGIARRHGLLIIEDDAYRFLVPDAPPPVGSFAPERTFYICSASKALAAGLRVGFVLVPEGNLTQVAAGIRASVWMTPPLTAEIACRWIMDGTATHFAARHRAEVAARQAMARRLLGATVARSHAGAYHLWMQLPEPWRADEFTARARSRNVRIVAAEAFAASHGHSPRAIRICLGAVASRERLMAGLEALAQTLAEKPSPPPTTA